MAWMKGAELITDYLIANNIPYVFGICGHGNVGMLDPLYHLPSLPKGRTYVVGVDVVRGDRPLLQPVEKRKGA